jgi:hypothetical protein
VEPAVTAPGLNVVWLAAINVVSLVLMAVITNWFASRKDAAAATAVLVAAEQQAKLRSSEKAEDWRRQDAVAEKVAAAAIKTAGAADLLLQAQADTVKRTDEVARLAAETDKRVFDKLGEIHILVNSDMTAARTAERDAMQLLAVSLDQQRLANLKIGIPVAPALMEQIEYAKTRIVELDQILADRHAAQKRIDDEAAAAGRAPARRGGDIHPTEPPA